MSQGGDMREQVGQMTTVAAQMSVKLRTRLEKIAGADERTLSYVIRKACEEYADRVEANGRAA